MDSTGTVAGAAPAVVVVAPDSERRSAAGGFEPTVAGILAAARIGAAVVVSRSEVESNPLARAAVVGAIRRAGAVRFEYLAGGDVS